MPHATNDSRGLPFVRTGLTTTYKLGAMSMHITVNTLDGEPCEMFGKCENGHQGELDGLCILASRILRVEGVEGARWIIAKFRHRRYEPRGGPGQPCSISDALAVALEQTISQQGTSTCQ